MTPDEGLDVVALGRLHAAYADTCSRRAFTELAGQFLPDAEVVVDRRSIDPVRLVGPAALGEFISTALEPFEFFEFVVLNSHFVLGDDGTSATGRMWMSELRQDRASGRWTVIYGLYTDRYARVDGRWWFAHRLYRTLARTAPDFPVFPVPGDDAAAGDP
jgi:hypothetical protein